MFQTGDGCGSNCKYYKLHDKSNTPHKAVNVYDPNGRWLYFFSDVPHLIKTARNCLSHSSTSDRFKRHLWVSIRMRLFSISLTFVNRFNILNALLPITIQNNSLTLEWKHVEELYEATVSSASRSLGLRLAHKLTRKHVYFTPHSRMRVDLAAQVILLFAL